MLILIISRTLHGLLEIRNFSSRNENPARDGEEKFRISALLCNVFYFNDLSVSVSSNLSMFPLTKILFNSGTFSYRNDILYILGIGEIW